MTALPAGTGTPSFTTPTVTFPGGAPGTVGTVMPLAGPTNNGNGTWTETWTETINSTVAGTFNVQASDQVTMGGVAVTRTTGDTHTGDSASAVKTYISLQGGVHGDISKPTDPEFIDLAVKNNSNVPLFLQSINDQQPTTGHVLLGNLLISSPSITATITPGGGSAGPAFTPTKGLQLAAGATLDVLVTRTVLSTDPDPSIFVSTFGFNSVQNPTAQNPGTPISVSASDTVNLFKPSVTIGLAVDKTSAPVGSTVTYTVTITNTSTSHSLPQSLIPHLVFNNSPAILNKTTTVTGLSSASVFHLFTTEAVMGAGIPVGTTIIGINKLTNTITLSKAATISGSTTLLFGFGATVAPPAGFQFPAAALATLEDFAAGDKVTFSYTHVVTATPSPLTNTVTMNFYVADTGLHAGALAFTNRVRATSNLVSTTTQVVFSKANFF